MGVFVDEYLKKKKELQDMMDYFRLEGGYGYPVMNEDDIKELQKLHEEALSSLDQAMENEPEAEELKNAYSEQQEMEMDSRVLHYAEAGMKLPELLNKTKTLSFQVGDEAFQSFGGQMSNRQRMAIPGPNGKPMVGYFTEKAVLDLEKNAELLTTSYSKKYPEMKSIFERYVRGYLNLPKNKSGFREIPEGDNDLYAARVGNEYFDIDVLTAFKKSLSAAQETKGVYANNISDKSNGRIDSRNAAMKNVANMLGVGHLIPETFMMNVVRGDQVLEGTFMQEVNGANFSDRKKEGSGLQNLKADSFDNPSVLKQMTDLAILDFICGNVDRHEGNMMLIFDKEDPSKVIGIKGIDNDLSFGNGKAWDWQQAKTDVKCLPYISKSMMDRLVAVKNVLGKCLEGMELPEKAIEEMNARVDSVLQKIEKKDTLVLSDKDFENKTLAEMSNSEIQKRYAKHKNGRRFLKDLFVVVDDAANATVKFNEKVASGEEKLEAPNKAKADTKPLKLYSGYTTDFLNMDLTYIGRLDFTVAEAKRNVHFGSPEYDKAADAVSALYAATKEMGLKGKITDAESLTMLNNVYADTIKKVDAYLNYKGNENKYKVGSKPYKRIQAMKQVKEFCKNKCRLMEKSLEAFEKAAMKKEADELLNSEGGLMNKYDQKKEILTGIIDICKKAPDDKVLKIRACEQIRALKVFDGINKAEVEKIGLTDGQFKDLKSIVKEGIAAEAESKRNAQTKQHEEVQNSHEIRML